MLSPTDIEHYERDGYLVVEDVLTDEQVAALRQGADDWVESSRQVEVNGDVFDLEPGHSRERPHVRRIKNPAAINEAYDSVMRGAAVLDIVTQLLGPDIRYQSTKLNMKSAGVGSPVEWHQDWAFYPHTNDDVLAVGVVIDDMSLDNGCLLVMPGSHRALCWTTTSTGSSSARSPRNWSTRRACVPLEAPAGSITVHHARTLHGSAPNTSGRPRRLFLVEYMRSDAWPLLGITWPDLECRQLRGAPCGVPRLEALPVRIPLPLPERTGSIYELQANEPERTSFAVGAVAKG